MPSESSFWRYLNKKMKLVGWEAKRFECSMPLGVPDVYYRIKGKDRWHSGWIELKFLKAYPKNKNIAIKIQHYTKEQRLFLRQENLKGGTAWLFIKIEKDYYLLKGDLKINEITYEDLKKYAKFFSKNTINSTHLKEVLCKCL